MFGSDKLIKQSWIEVSWFQLGECELDQVRVTWVMFSGIYDREFGYIQRWGHGQGSVDLGWES